MTDFDPEFDKLPDQPPTIIGGDKSAAAWQPKAGPEVPHADLIARLRKEADYQLGFTAGVAMLEAANVLESLAGRLSIAELKAQALDEAAIDARRKWEPYNCPWVGFLDDRAAEIREKANQ